VGAEVPDEPLNVIVCAGSSLLASTPVLEVSSTQHLTLRRHVAAIDPTRVNMENVKVAAVLYGLTRAVELRRDSMRSFVIPVTQIKVCVAHIRWICGQKDLC
jgi:hypothetical protein